jgi:WS/DGAT/MGAT family acyltransferase
MAKTIPMLDLMFFLTETQDNPRHVGATQIFKRPSGARASLVQEIVDAYRKARPSAPFNQIPVFQKVGLPEWRVVDDIDMSHHVLHLALPPPGSNEQLHQLIADLHAPIMERHRPGWKTYIIEGLAGDRFAIYHKVHHALVDGESGMAIMRRSLSTTATDRKIRPTSCAPVHSPPRTVPSGLRKILEKEASRMARRTLSIGRGSMRLIEDTLGGLRGFSSTEKRAFTAPATPMNRPIYNARAVTHRVFPLSTLKSIASTRGATLNDVVLCILDAGVNRYLREMGEPPDHPLVCLVPVSLRDAGVEEATTQVSAIWPMLGSVNARIDRRLEEIMANTRAAKDQLSRLGKDAAYAYAVLTFAMSETLVIAQPDILGLRPANLLISNVRGPEQALYLNGAKLEALFPVSTLIVGVGLNITFMSYDGRIVMGFTGNGSALPDIESMGRYTEEAFESLRKAVLQPKRSAKKSRKAGRASKKKLSTPRKKR